MKKLKMTILTTLTIVVMGVGIISTTNSYASAPGGGGGGGCYTSTVLDCGSVGFIHYGTMKFCDFTGYYGYPYRCTTVNCDGSKLDRECVQP
jgi:hypothetical protein